MGCYNEEQTHTEATEMVHFVEEVAFFWGPIHSRESGGP